MADFDHQFVFERSIVRIRGGGSFQPLKDAVGRWVKYARSAYEILGHDFEILYELSNSDFVVVDYFSCKQIPARLSDGSEVLLWNSDGSFDAKIKCPTDAMRWLIEGQFEISDRMAAHIAAMEAEDAIVVADLAPRALSYWAEGDHVGVQSQRKAHAENAIESARELVDFGTRAIQLLRHTGPIVHDRIDPLRVVEVTLFSTYPVDPAHWWGAKDRLPPAAVGILDLWWPPGADGVRSTIRTLQNVLRAPLSVIAVARLNAFSSDRPTEEELSAGEDALLACLDDFERLVLELRAGLDALDAPRDIPADEKPKVKRPPDSAFLAFRLLVLGMKQEEVATKLLDYGVTATQGTVSRWKDQVWEWLEACNVFPPMPEPIRRKPSSIDPKVIDQGANQERRTPRQRPKKKEE